MSRARDMRRRACGAEALSTRNGRNTFSVVPANAGTHTPCAIVWTVADAFCNNQRQGLWVPAFAGTTLVCVVASGDQIKSPPAADAVVPCFL